MARRRTDLDRIDLEGREAGTFGHDGSTRADAAIDDFSSALRFDPKLASALYGRGLARLRNGDKAGGDADISAARTIQAGLDDDFIRYGVRDSN